MPADKNVPEVSPAQPLKLRRHRLLAVAAVAAGAAGLAVAWFLLRPQPAKEPLPPIKGFVDVQIVAPGDPQRDHVRLGRKGALPLRPGDQVRVEVELNRPAYVYLLWIDSTGHVTPVYPWHSGRWSRLPNLEKPIERANLPDDRKEGLEIAGTEPGMETVVLLARDEVLPPEVELGSLVFNLPPVRAQNPQAAVWFENGAVVRDEADRTPQSFDPDAPDDPLLQRHALLLDRLRPHFRYVRSVSFASAGR